MSDHSFRSILHMKIRHKFNDIMQNKQLNISISHRQENRYTIRQIDSWTGKGSLILTDRCEQV
jgi:hypothetical protein